MNQKYFYVILILILVGTNLSAQEKEETFGINFTGFVSSEVFYDTRQNVDAREGDVFLYPAKEVLDANGNDINDKPSFNLATIHSRLNAGITGPKAFGAKTSGTLEFDFVGTTDNGINMIRMRHAFVKLSWENTSILFGQFWHPMFVLDCYVDVASWNAAIPISVLSRTPQFRITQNLGTNLFVMGTLLTQRSYASNGPDGTSSKYLRNSGIPEVQTQLGYKSNSLAAGLLFGYKTLLPRLQTSVIGGEAYKSDETIGSFETAAYFKFITDPVTFKVMGYYGQNLYNYVMLGGYAESTTPDPVTGAVEYTNYKTSSVWTEINTNGKTFQYALFAGITNNLGTDDEIMGTTYARGTDIDYVYRISPRVSWIADKVRVTLELLYTTAAYGTPDSFGKVQEAEEVNSLRTLLSVKYSF
jgi:hypothetical protein